jgi:hypothetical protein
LAAKSKYPHRKTPVRVFFSLSKNPGVDKGPQPIMALFGFGDMCGKSAKSACAARLSLHSVLAAP